MSFDFDARVNSLTVAIKDESEARVKSMHEQNQRKIEEGLIYEFGTLDDHRKKLDFVDLGAMPWSVIAFHNAFQRQIRTAFVMGAYYPALAGACGLGERILNHLVLMFREQFRNSASYKHVYSKDSFDNWELAIRALESWSILRPEVAQLFREFCVTRNRGLHFRPEVDSNARGAALEAIGQLNKIISEQFGCCASLPWLFPVPGETYVRKSAECDPFVKGIYLPNCHLVGYKHRLDLDAGRFVLRDDDEYEECEITDEEFSRLRRANNAPARPT